MAGSQWSLLPLPTHKGTAPFLHMGALAAITVLSWIVAGQFARTERSCKYDWAGPAPPQTLEVPGQLVLPSPRRYLGGLGMRWGPHSQGGRFLFRGFHRGLQPHSALFVSSSASLSVSVCELEFRVIFPERMGAASGAGSPQSIWVLTGGGKRGPPTSSPGLMFGPGGSRMLTRQCSRPVSTASQVAILCTFFAVVFALYLAPLTISSPCLMEKKDLGPKPSLIGHRGAPMVSVI